MGDKENKLTKFLIRKGFLLLFLFIFLLLLAPQANAVNGAPSIPTGQQQSGFDLWGWAGDKLFDASLGNLARLATTVIGGILLSLATLWVSLAAYLLEWVISPDFISLSYTGLNNPIIKMGWDITSDLANMGIVLALIVIGLATILRIESYQAKKALPTLIIVALLVNFAPVLLGIIVDASNILMNFLLKGSPQGPLNFASLANGFAEVRDSISGAWSNAGSDSATQLAILGRTCILVAFSLVAGLIFFLFAALFTMRYVAIWVAVILSPLAFVSYILPKTRVFFLMWWKQFFAWCFIGVFAAFFIYLSVHMIETINIEQYVQKAEDSRARTAVQIGEADKNAMDQLLPYGVISAFLILGFFMTVSLSAMGANTIVDLTKKGLGRGGKGLARQTLGRAATSKQGKGVARWLSRKWEPKSGAGKALRTAFSPVGWAVRKAGAGALSYSASLQDRINEDKEKIKKKFGKDYKSMAAYTSSLSFTNYTGRIAGAQALAETKGAKGLNKLPLSDLRSIVKQTDRYAPKSLDNLIKHTPELIEDEEIGKLIIDNLIDEKDIIEQMKSGLDIGRARVKAAFKEAAKALKDSDAENLSDETLGNEELQEALAKYASWGVLRQIGEKKGGKHLSNIQRAGQERVGIEELARTNPNFLRLPYTPGGQVYFDNWRGAKGTGDKITSKEAINELIRKSSLSREEEERREREARERYKGKSKTADSTQGRRAGGSSAQGSKPGSSPVQGRKP